MATRARAHSTPPTAGFAGARHRAVEVLIGVVMIAVVWSSAPFGGIAEAAPTPPPTPDPAPSKTDGPAGGWVTATGAGLSRPDFVSAGVTARASGLRVEVLSARTSSSRSWVLPTGAVEVESTSLVRFADAKATDTDGWRDIDTSLKVAADGSLSPAAVPGSVRLAGGGVSDGSLVSVVDADGQSVAVGSGLNGVALPKPVVDGSVATYPDVLAGVDLRVEVARSGFEQLWVIKTQTGLTNLLKSRTASGLLGLETGLSTAKLSARPEADGSVVLTTTKGKEAGRLAAPSMWDAQLDPATKAPINVKPVKFVLSDGAKTLAPNDSARSGKLGLRVAADTAWLSDSARQFPITIDPTYASVTASPSFDTWVQDGVTTDQSGSTQLRLGKNSSGKVSRSFLNWPTTAIQNKLIMSASLELWESSSATCTAKGWSSTNSALVSTATRWTAQPTLFTTYATATATKGFSSACAAGPVAIDMKDQAQTWADAPGTYKTTVLRAVSETDALAAKTFDSLEGVHPPKLTYTYNRAPVTPPAPTVAGALSYTPVGSSTSYLYTADTAPVVSGPVSDPDRNNVRGYFNATAAANGSGTVLSTCSQGSLASGSTATCELGTALTSNTKVYVRQQTKDSQDTYSTWGPTRELRIAATTPTAPVITCPGYPTNSWATTGPSSNLTCTITAVGSGYSAPSAIRYTINSGAAVIVQIPQSSSTATAKITVPIDKADGSHRLAARAISPSGQQSDRTTVWTAGWGAPSLITPAPGEQVTTTDTVAVKAAGPPTSGGGTASTATLQWRVAGATSTTSGWVNAPAGNSIGVNGSAGWANATGTLDTTTVVGQTDGNSITVPARTSTLIDLRVCFSYGSDTLCTPASTVLRVPHAFGAGYPVTGAGPGQVALWTGELQVDDTDATLSAPGGDLSVSRTHSSFAGPATTQNKVFGPGWVAAFDSDSAGFGDAELLDGTPIDGSLVILDSGGEPLVFTTPTTGNRRIGSALPTGIYQPGDINTRTAEVSLKVSGSGAATVAELTSSDGIITKFQVLAAPTTAPVTFRTVEVRETATTAKTTYSYDTSGRVTAIIAPLPDGVTVCNPGTPTAGCRVLKINYATSTTATSSTPGDFNGQVKSITAQVNTDTDRTLATYQYDLSGRLVQATDTRTGLTTSSTWTGTGTGLRLATMTPPGEAAFTFNYANDRVTSVTRPNPASAGGGTTQVAAYIYNVPVAGTVKDLPDMGAEVDKWGQTSAPDTIQAVFGPDKPISGAPAAGSQDWKYADLQMTDPNGYTVNTATYGAGDWQLSGADYDTHDNVIRAWDERATRALLDGLYETGAADQLATITVYNDDILNGTTILTPAGTLVTDTYGPVHQVASGAADDGTVPLRVHSRAVFDQGAPVNGSGVNPDTGQPFRLPTKTVTTSETIDGTIDSTLDITLTGYGPVVSGDTSGWTLGQATTMTTDMDQSGTVNAGDITTTTRYDARGRIIENRQPTSTGSDAGTRVTTFYTAGTSPVSGCGSNAAYAGMVCKVGPAAQPAGQTMPVTTSTVYTWDGQTGTQIDTSGAVSSTTTTSFDVKDRPQTVTTSVSGLASSTAVPAVTTSYDSATGNVTGTSSTAGSSAMTYDNWGRQLTYTNTPAGQTGDTATTTYNPVGQVVSVVDGNGQTGYTYGLTDANGKSERRGLVTSVKVKLTGGTEYESTGGYDESGALIVEKLPGRIIKRSTLDITGEQTALTYNGQAINPDTSAVEDDRPWLGWTTLSNARGQTAREWTPDGAAFDGQLGVTAIASDRTYSYDRAGRLTKVQDRTGNLDGTNPVACETRTYGFDSNGNRTGQNSIGADSNGDCTTTGGTPVTRAYDTADRPTTGANGTGSYIYDPLGRQTTIPAADAPKPGDGNITLGYYDTDAVKTITQNGGTTSYTLDGATRRLTQTRATGGTTTNTLTRHYTDSGDNPTWTADTTGSSTTNTRYNELIDGNLGLTLTTSTGTTTAALNLNTPRGDTASTITLPTGATGPGATAATGIDSWTSYTEYGNPQQPPNTTPGGSTGIGYGWLGAKQRATLDTGLTLMGARLYNRATGAFATRDPIFGGNSTPFAYPSDPINLSDISGKALGPHQVVFCSFSWNLQVCGFALGFRSKAINSGWAYFSGKRSHKYRGNAFQHAFWMALIVVSMRRSGYSASGAKARAREFGVVHERDDKYRFDAESLKDLRNNHIGARIGSIAFSRGWSTAKLTQRIRYLAGSRCRGRNCLQVFW